MANINALSARQTMEKRYSGARLNILLVAAFTLLNSIFLAAESGTFFLFSAYIPYLLVDMGMLFCGLYPAEYYGEYGFEVLFGASYFPIFAGAAAVLLILYIVSWIFSKNRGGWMIFALVFFSVDTVLMVVLLGFQLDNIVDMIFHIWVIVSLSLGVSAYSKLKKLPAEEAKPADTWQAWDLQAETPDSPSLRMAEPEAKEKILLQAQALGRTIVYRRVKRTNELVIGGRVYDELEALVEPPHTLSARIDGHLIEAGLESPSRSFIRVDGQTIAKKTRWV